MANSQFEFNIRTVSIIVAHCFTNFFAHAFALFFAILNDWAILNGENMLCSLQTRSRMLLAEVNTALFNIAAMQSPFLIPLI